VNKEKWREDFFVLERFDGQEDGWNGIKVDRDAPAQILAFGLCALSGWRAVSVRLLSARRDTALPRRACPRAIGTRQAAGSSAARAHAGRSRVPPFCARTGGG